MAKVSILIPSRNEKFMPQTVEDIFAHAGGEIEVIVVLDGYYPAEVPADRPNLHYIHWGKARGMRAGINAAATLASGQYLLKADAHCSFAPGFDLELQSECADNWIVVARRLSLDAEAWKPQGKEPIDAEYYFYPFTPGHEHEPGLHARPWSERGRARREFLLDEDLSWQGSFWFMHRAHFWERLGGMSEAGYETFMGEPQELGLKTQLGPWEGAIMRNKRTWIAHLHKGKTYGRMYSMSASERSRGNAYSFDFWWNNRWGERAHDLEWLLDRFGPLPGWPANWKEMKQ